MSPFELERYLHEHLPLTSAMQVFVVSLQPGEVTLGAPLQPNINHKSGVFGGSAATLAITAAWSLVHMRMRAAGIAGQLVIQRNTMDFTLPMTSDFAARAFLPGAAAWPKFAQMFERRGRARITVPAELICRGRVSGCFEGEFVALGSEYG